MENNNTNKFNPDDMVREADARFLSVMKEGKFGELMSVMPGLGHYTLRNQMLILSQKGDATNVNNMQGWNYRKRSIKPGEKSLKILAPTFAKQVMANADGTVTEKVLDKVTGYEVRFVFDESQTNGEQLTDILDTKVNVDKNELIKTALKATVKDFTYGVSSELADGADAILDTESKTITLREGLPQDKELKTLINQIAAANVLMRDRNHFRGLNSYEIPNIMGVEINGVSHIVGKRLGLEMPITQPNFEKVSDENIAKFAENIGVIRSISQKMVAAVENAIERQAQEEKEQVASTDSLKTLQAETSSQPKQVANATSKKAKTITNSKQGVGMC